MSDSGLASPSPNNLRRQTVAVGALFFVNGAVYSNWLPRVDEVRDRLGIGNGGLGVALLGGGLGGLIGSLLVARLLGRYSTVQSVGVAAIGLALTFPLIAVVPNVASLLILLSLFGFLDVVNDTSMNAEAADIQSRLPNSVMQRMHAMWSLGFTVGGIAGWVASVADVPLGAHFVAVSVTLVAAVAWILSVLREGHRGSVVHHEAQASRAPRIGLPFIAMLAVAVAFLEMPPNEWGAITMRDLFDAGATKGAAPVVFSAFMLIGRLLGDRIVDRIGPRATMWYLLWVCLGGIATTAVAPHEVVALVGFAVWGLGVSVLFPQVYLLAANSRAGQPSVGLAVMSFGQRAAFLTSSVVVGNVAELSNIRVAFGMVLFGAGALYVVSLSRWRRESL